MNDIQKQVLDDVANEVEAPKAVVVEEKKDSLLLTYAKEAWVALILPALKEFWKANGKEILASLKDLGIKLFKSVVMNKGEEKK